MHRHTCFYLGRMYWPGTLLFLLMADNALTRDTFVSTYGRQCTDQGHICFYLWPTMHWPGTHLLLLMADNALTRDTFVSTYGRQCTDQGHICFYLRRMRRPMTPFPLKENTLTRDTFASAEGECTVWIPDCQRETAGSETCANHLCIQSSRDTFT